MQGQPGQPSHLASPTVPPAADLQELLKEIKELKAGLLGNSVTHDNPTFEGPPWQDQRAIQNSEGLRLDIPMEDLDDSLEDMVARDAKLQYILSPQAEEQVVRSSLRFEQDSLSPQRAAAAVSPAGIPAFSGTPVTPADAAVSRRAGEQQHGTRDAPQTSAISSNMTPGAAHGLAGPPSHTTPAPPASSASSQGKAGTPTSTGTMRKFGSRIARPATSATPGTTPASATPAGRTAPASSTALPTPGSAIRSTSTTQPHPATPGVAAAAGPATQHAAGASAAVRTGQANTPLQPRTTRQKLAAAIGAIGAIGAIATAGRGTTGIPSRNAASSGASPAGSVGVARSASGSGSSGLSGSLFGASARKRPPQGGPEAQAGAPTRKVASTTALAGAASTAQSAGAAQSHATAGSSAAKQGRTPVASSTGAASRIPGRSIAQSGVPSVRGSGATSPLPPTSPAAAAAAAAAATSAAALPPAAVAQHAQPVTAAAAASSEMECELSHPSLTLPSHGGADLLAGESLEAMLEEDPALDSWLAASKQADATGAGGSGTTPTAGGALQRRSSDDLLQTMAVAMGDNHGDDDWMDGDADAEMSLLMQGGSAVDRTAAGSADRNAAAAVLTSAVVSTPAPLPRPHDGFENTPSPHLQSRSAASTALAAAAARSSREPLGSTVCKVREMLGLDQQLDQQDGLDLNSEELWRNINAEANSIFSEQGGSVGIDGRMGMADTASSTAAATTAEATSAPASPAVRPTAEAMPEALEAGQGSPPLQPELSAEMSRAMSMQLGPPAHEVVLSGESSGSAHGPLTSQDFAGAAEAAAAAIMVPDSMDEDDGAGLELLAVEAAAAMMVPDSMDEDDGAGLELLAAEAAAAAAVVVGGGSLVTLAGAEAEAALEDEPAGEAAALQEEVAGGGRRLLHQSSSASSFGFDAAVAFEAALISRQLAGVSTTGGVRANAGCEDAIMEEGEEITSPAAMPPSMAAAAVIDALAAGAFTDAGEPESSLDMVEADAPADGLPSGLAAAALADAAPGDAHDGAGSYLMAAEGGEADEVALPANSLESAAAAEASQGLTAAVALLAAGAPDDGLGLAAEGDELGVTSASVAAEARADGTIAAEELDASLQEVEPSAAAAAAALGMTAAGAYAAAKEPPQANLDTALLSGDQGDLAAAGTTASSVASAVAAGAMEPQAGLDMVMEGSDQDKQTARTSAPPLVAAAAVVGGAAALFAPPENRLSGSDIVEEDGGGYPGEATMPEATSPSGVVVAAAVLGAMAADAAEKPQFNLDMVVDGGDREAAVPGAASPSGPAAADVLGAMAAEDLDAAEKPQLGLDVVMDGDEQGELAAAGDASLAVIAATALAKAEAATAAEELQATVGMDEDGGKGVASAVGAVALSGAARVVDGEVPAEGFEAKEADTAAFDSAAGAAGPFLADKGPHDDVALDEDAAADGSGGEPDEPMYDAEEDGFEVGQAVGGSSAQLPRLAPSTADVDGAASEGSIGTVVAVVAPIMAAAAAANGDATIAGSGAADVEMEPSAVYPDLSSAGAPDGNTDDGDDYDGASDELPHKAPAGAGPALLAAAAAAGAATAASVKHTRAAPNAEAGANDGAVSVAATTDAEGTTESAAARKRARLSNGGPTAEGVEGGLPAAAASSAASGSAARVAGSGGPGAAAAPGMETARSFGERLESDASQVSGLSTYASSRMMSASMASNPDLNRQPYSANNGLLGVEPASLPSDTFSLHFDDMGSRYSGRGASPLGTPALDEQPAAPSTATGSFIAETDAAASAFPAIAAVSGELPAEPRASATSSARSSSAEDDSTGDDKEAEGGPAGSIAGAAALAVVSTGLPAHLPASVTSGARSSNSFGEVTDGDTQSEGSPVAAVAAVSSDPPADNRASMTSSARSSTSWGEVTDGDAQTDGIPAATGAAALAAIAAAANGLPADDSASTTSSGRSSTSGGEITDGDTQIEGSPAAAGAAALTAIPAATLDLSAGARGSMTSSARTISSGGEIADGDTQMGGSPAAAGAEALSAIAAVSSDLPSNNRASMTSSARSSTSGGGVTDSDTQTEGSPAAAGAAALAAVAAVSSDLPADVRGSMTSSARTISSGGEVADGDTQMEGSPAAAGAAALAAIAAATSDLPAEALESATSSARTISSAGEVTDADTQIEGSPAASGAAALAAVGAGIIGAAAVSSLAEEAPDVGTDRVAVMRSEASDLPDEADRGLLSMPSPLAVPPADLPALALPSPAAKASAYGAGGEDVQRPLLHAWQVLAPTSPSAAQDGDTQSSPTSKGPLGARASMRSMLSNSSRLSRVSSRKDEADASAKHADGASTGASPRSAGAGALTAVAAATASFGHDADTVMLQPEDDAVIGGVAAADAADIPAALADAEISDDGTAAVAASQAAVLDGPEAAVPLEYESPVAMESDDVTPPLVEAHAAAAAAVQPDAGQSHLLGGAVAAAAVSAVSVASERAPHGVVGDTASMPEEELVPAWKFTRASNPATGAPDSPTSGESSPTASRASLGCRRSLRNLPVSSGSSRLKRNTSHSNVYDDVPLGYRQNSSTWTEAEPEGGPSSARGRGSLDSSRLNSPNSAAATTSVAAAIVPDSPQCNRDDEGQLAPAWKLLATPGETSSGAGAAARGSPPLGAQPSFRSSRAGNSRLHRASAPDSEDFDFAGVVATYGAAEPRLQEPTAREQSQDAEVPVDGAGDDLTAAATLLELGLPLGRNRSRTLPGNNPTDADLKLATIGSAPTAAAGSYSSDGCPPPLLRGGSTGRIGGPGASSMRRTSAIDPGTSPVRGGAGAMSEHGGTAAAWAMRASSRRLMPDTFGSVPMPRRSSVGGGDPNVDALRPAWQVLPLTMSAGSNASSVSAEAWAAAGGSAAGAPSAANMLASMRSSSRLSRMSSGIPEELLAELRLHALAAVGHLQGSPHGDDSGGGLADMTSSVEDSAVHPRLLAGDTAPSSDDPTSASGDGAGGTVHAWKVLPLRVPAPSSSGFAPEQHTAQVAATNAGGFGGGHAASSSPPRVSSLGGRPPLMATRANNPSSRLAVASTTKAPALQVSFEQQVPLTAAAVRASREPALPEENEQEDDESTPVVPRSSAPPPPPAAALAAAVDEHDAAVLHAWKLVAPSPMGPAPPSLVASLDGATAAAAVPAQRDSNGATSSGPTRPPQHALGARRSLKSIYSVGGSRLSRSSIVLEDYVDESYSAAPAPAGAEAGQADAASAAHSADHIAPADSANQSAVAAAAAVAALAAAAAGNAPPAALSRSQSERTSAPAATARERNSHGSTSRPPLVRVNTTGSMHVAAALMHEPGTAAEGPISHALNSRPSLRSSRSSNSGSRLSRMSSARDGAAAAQGACDLGDIREEDSESQPQSQRGGANTAPIAGAVEATSPGSGPQEQQKPPQLAPGGDEDAPQPALQVQVPTLPAEEEEPLVPAWKVFGSASAPSDGAGGAAAGGADGAESSGSRHSPPGLARRSLRSSSLGSSRLSRMASQVSDAGLADIVEEAADSAAAAAAATAGIAVPTAAAVRSDSVSDVPYDRASSGRAPPPAPSAGSARIGSPVAAALALGQQPGSPAAAMLSGASEAGPKDEPLLPAWKVFASSAQTPTDSGDVDVGERTSPAAPLGATRQPSVLRSQRSGNLGSSRLRRVTSGLGDEPVTSSATADAAAASPSADPFSAPAADPPSIEDSPAIAVAAAAPALAAAAAAPAGESADSGVGEVFEGGIQAVAAPPVAGAAGVAVADVADNSGQGSHLHSVPEVESITTTQDYSNLTLANLPSVRFDRGSSVSNTQPAVRVGSGGFSSFSVPPAPTSGTGPSRLTAGGVIKEEEVGTPQSRQQSQSAVPQDRPAEVVPATAEVGEAVTAAAPPLAGAVAPVTAATPPPPQQQQQLPTRRSRGILSCLSCFGAPDGAD